VWFSNRRAKWRREEKLRSQRRDVVPAGGGSGGLDVTGFGVASGLSISTATGAPGFNVNSCSMMYPAPAVAAVAADPYRYHELADTSLPLSFLFS